jgi:hypothetical protein
MLSDIARFFQVMGVGWACRSVAAICVGMPLSWVTTAEFTVGISHV